MNKTNGRKALVIGAGVAGPLTALALQKAGVRATVYEAFAASAGLAAGSWLTVAVNGLDALRTLGLHEAVMALGFRSEAIELVSGTGRLLGRVPIGGRLDDGTVTHTLRRSDLYGLLTRTLAARGIALESCKRLTALRETADGVTATFEDGTEATGDFVVGADGVHSRVRRLLDPGAPSPRYTGFGNIGGFAPGPLAGIAPGVYRMVFGKHAFFGYTAAPSGEVWWFANPPGERQLDPTERATTDWHLRLLGLFADDRGPMLDLIRATAGELGYTNQYELAEVPVWQRGRAVLIGDAAHAASPPRARACPMAAEDAVALAVSVRDASDTEAGLRAFVAARRERAEKVVAYGRRFASTKSVGPVGRALRDLAMPLVLRMQARTSGPESLGWLYQHHIAWGDEARGLAAGG